MKHYVPRKVVQVDAPNRLGADSKIGILSQGGATNDSFYHCSTYRGIESVENAD